VPAPVVPVPVVPVLGGTTGSVPVLPVAFGTVVSLAPAAGVVVLLVASEPLESAPAAGFIASEPLTGLVVLVPPVPVSGGLGLSVSVVLAGFGVTAGAGVGLFRCLALRSACSFKKSG
jgi:hypothetical protein